MDTTGSIINYDDFAKLELRVATVLECKPHANADKLLVLQIDLGNGEHRQICAGLRNHYQPEQLIGKQIVVDNRGGAGSTLGTNVVANAKPDGYTLLMSETTFGIVPAQGTEYCRPQMRHS